MHSSTMNTRVHLLLLLELESPKVQTGASRMLALDRTAQATSQAALDDDREDQMSRLRSGLEGGELVLSSLAVCGPSGWTARLILLRLCPFCRTSVLPIFLCRPQQDRGSHRSPFP